MKYFKNIKRIATVLLIGLTFGCENLIEVAPPQAQLITTAVFENAGTANAAISDIYARMRDSGLTSGTINGLSYLLGNYSDELEYHSSNMDILSLYNHTHVASNASIARIWNTAYGQIYAANSIIEGLQNTTAIPIDTKNQLMGEALFIRGYLHFYLTNVFGAIPYVTSTNYKLNSSIDKETESQIMQFITNDLLEAEKLLPTGYPSFERVRPNKAVATAFLSKIYLFMGDWQKAELYSTSVIENPVYKIEDIANVFLLNSQETIWSFHPGVAGVNTNEAKTFIFTSGPPTKAYLTTNLINAFEPGDNRKNLWVKKITGGANSWYHAWKYKKTTNTGTSQEYTILFRLAEQYLIRAEARAMQNKLSAAQFDLNKIRNRAALPNTKAQTKEELLSVIMQERKVELFTEQGNRWFDLKRTNTANGVIGSIKSQWKPTHVLWPLPEKEILLNKNLLPQNSGY